MKNLALLTLVLASPAVLAGECASLVDQAEKQMSNKIARKAIEVCHKEGVKTARHHIVLSRISFETSGYDDVIKHSDNALKEEPGLALAYMNKCAAYEQMRKYEEAIASCKAGLAKPSPWSAMINFNLGLAHYGKHIDVGAFQNLTESEPYFLESVKLDPKLDQSYYFLGLISQGPKKDPKKAVEYFKKGCALKHEKSCDAISQATLEAKQMDEAKAEAAKYEASQKAKDAAFKEASKIDPKVEAALWKEMENNFLKKGVPADAVGGIISSSKESVNAASPDQRLKLIKELVDASK